MLVNGAVRLLIQNVSDVLPSNSIGFLITHNRKMYLHPYKLKLKIAHRKHIALSAAWKRTASSFVLEFLKAPYSIL